jgi:hypothetical protein
MPFDYYKKLTARQRRTYDRSAAIGTVPVPTPERLAPEVAGVAAGLGSGSRVATERAVQRLTEALLGLVGVPPVDVRVLAKRPSKSWGELHGLYEPAAGKRHGRITVWMRTAQRKDVVAFRTFMRTLLHEIGHHLDYELLKLDDSMHTEGFYKRESNLFRQIVPDPARFEAPADAASPGPMQRAARPRESAAPEPRRSRRKQAQPAPAAGAARQRTLFED